MVTLGRDSGEAPMLARGWHKPEPWGCWTNGTDATLCIAFAAPLSGTFRLDLDLVPPPTLIPLTLTVNGHGLPPRMPEPGRNAWTLPRVCTQGFTASSVDLNVEDTFCPAQSAGSIDDRILGIGVRAVGLYQVAVSTLRLNENVRISRDVDAPDVLEADGTGWSRGGAGAMVPRPPWRWNLTTFSAARSSWK